MLQKCKYSPTHFICSPFWNYWLRSSNFNQSHDPKMDVTWVLEIDSSSALRQLSELLAKHMAKEIEYFVKKLLKPNWPYVIDIGRTRRWKRDQF